MTHQILTGITLLILATGAQAAVINVNDYIFDTESLYNADNVPTGQWNSNNSSCDGTLTAANCDFEQTFHAGTYLSNQALRNIVTSDYRTSVKSPLDANAFIDLTFTDTVVNGAGNDLVLFFIGNTTSFGLDVYDIDGGLINSGDYTIATPTFDTANNTVLYFGDTIRDSNGDWLCISSTDPTCAGGYALSAILFDFGEGFEGTEIGSLHLTLGDSNFSLASGFHTQTTVVPVPLSVVLFSSGLALLGWVGRRKAA